MLSRNEQTDLGEKSRMKAKRTFFPRRIEAKLLEGTGWLFMAQTRDTLFTVSHAMRSGVEVPQAKRKTSGEFETFVGEKIQPSTKLPYRVPARPRTRVTEKAVRLNIHLSFSTFSARGLSRCGSNPRRFASHSPPITTRRIMHEKRSGFRRGIRKCRSART